MAEGGLSTIKTAAILLIALSISPHTSDWIKGTIWLDAIRETTPMITAEDIIIGNDTVKQGLFPQRFRHDTYGEQLFLSSLWAKKPIYKPFVSVFFYCVRNVCRIFYKGDNIETYVVNDPWGSPIIDRAHTEYDHRISIGISAYTASFYTSEDMGAFKRRESVGACFGCVSGLTPCVGDNSGEPRLPPGYERKDDCEDRDERGGNCGKIVASLMNDNRDVGDHQPDAIDGAIIVIGIVLGLCLGWWIVATTPKCSDIENDQIRKNSHRRKD